MFKINADDFIVVSAKSKRFFNESTGRFGMFDKPPSAVPLVLDSSHSNEVIHILDPLDDRRRRRRYGT